MDTANNTKLGLARNSVYSFAKAIDLAYAEYQYSVLLDSSYSISSGILVNIDGNETYLDVNYNGDDVNCSSVIINSGKLSLSDCHIYGFIFDYENGVVSQK